MLIANNNSQYKSITSKLYLAVKERLLFQKDARPTASLYYCLQVEERNRTCEVFNCTLVPVHHVEPS